MTTEQHPPSTLTLLQRLTTLAIACVVGLTFVPSLWRLDPLIDEMYHLRSWRNRYGTDDPLPIFHVRLAASGSLTDGQKETLEHLYRTSPLFRQLLFVQSDPPSPLHSTLGEIIQAATNSNIVALRVPSLLAAIGAVWLMYLLGARLLDRGLAYCLAALACVGPLTQTYAGVGRSHMLAHFALTGLLYALLRDQPDVGRSPKRLLAWALLAQVCHWSAWAVVGPVVGAEFMRRLLAGCTLSQLLKQTWWYAIASIGLVGVFILQNVGTTAAGNMTGTFLGVWDFFSRSSPFGFVSQVGYSAAVKAAGAVFAGFAIAGAWFGLRDMKPQVRTFVVPVIAGACGSLIGMYFMAAGIRHLLIYQVPFVVLAGLGLRYACGSEIRACAVAFGMVLLSILVALLKPVDPYEHLLHGDVRYSQAAAVLKRELRPGDRWAAWPYYQASPFYRYGPFPEPLTPANTDELGTIMSSPNRPRFLWMTMEEESRNAALLPEPLERRVFDSRSVLLEYPPGSGNPDGAGRR